MLCDRIREARKISGLSVKELSAQVGINEGHLRHLEKGTKSPSLDTLIALCNALNVNPNVLLQDVITIPIGSDREEYYRLVARLSDKDFDLVSSMTRVLLEKMK